MKEPHNYRKVGYSMIVVSVSLVAIGLMVWAIGNNYHFSSNLMAGQEADAMTPKHGYDIVAFDHAAPVGAKLKLLDHADSINDTKKLQDQYQKSTKGAQILIFGTSLDSNVDLMARAEVAALTPAQGYNVIFFNNAMPVGAKLAMSVHDDLLVNATADEQKQQAANKDPEVSVIILSSSYDDNLKTVLGPGSTSAQPAQSTISMTQSIVSVNNTNAATTKLNNTNGTSSQQIGNEIPTQTGKLNATISNVNQTIINGTNKSLNLNESMGIASK
jgi:hypothetical protein